MNRNLNTGILVDLLETWELVHFDETYLKPALSLQ